MDRLPRSFYARSPVKVAESLVGRVLYRRCSRGLVAGRLVEVEAYCGANDPASHAHRRKTARNSVMFGPPGHLYVYLSYGMHHCANIVADLDGVAGAVLLRAVEPLEGLELMGVRRGVDKAELLARGPGRLAQAFGLTLDDYGADLTGDGVWVGKPRRLQAPVAASGRIGLRPEMQQPWRFYEPGPWVSGPRRSIG